MVYYQNTNSFFFCTSWITVMNNMNNIKNYVQCCITMLYDDYDSILLCKFSLKMQDRNGMDRNLLCLYRFQHSDKQWCWQSFEFLISAVNWHKSHVFYCSWAPLTVTVFQYIPGLPNAIKSILIPFPVDLSKTLVHGLYGFLSPIFVIEFSYNLHFTMFISETQHIMHMLLCTAYICL